MSTGLVGFLPSAAQADEAVYVDDISLAVLGASCVTTTVSATGTWADAPDGNTISMSADAGSGDLGDDTHDVTWTNETTNRVSAPLRVCGDQVVSGTYRITVSVTEFDYQQGDPTYSTGTGTVTLQVLPPVVTTIKVAKKRIHKGANRWQVTGRLHRSSAPYARQKVFIQARIGIDWENLNVRIHRTNAKGKVVFRIPSDSEGYRWRLHYEGNETTSASSSPTFRLRGNR